MAQAALLVLEEGSIFRGTAIGHTGQATGELVFNTAMTGYQEILTDPSYAQQIVCLTYPHIGNVGVNSDDEESQKTWASALVIRDLSIVTSNWRSTESLNDYLCRHKVVGIADIDTRQLTHILRDKGAQRACITTDVDNVEAAIALAKSAPALSGLDLAKEVSTKKIYEWTESTWQLDSDTLLSNASQTEKSAPENKKLKSEVSSQESKPHVVVYDFGVKRNILRLLVKHGCKVTVVPAQTSASEVFALNPDGIFLSNGPGDPAPCDYAIAATREFLDKNIPLFGICLGFQILALASGAQTYKMKFGHHGANHPVSDLQNKKVMITSQNHGFAVSQDNLPDCLLATHVSLFDGSLQGIRHRTKPAFAFQGHPEASPGPHDVHHLFADFIAMMK